MSNAVLCLRPIEDFLRVGVSPPASLSVTCAKPDDPELRRLIAAANALIIPAVGPPLPTGLFEGSKAALVQVTGAGVDRLDLAGMKALGIPVANVPGGSNAALAEYCIATALVLLRRFAFADAEIRAGRYAAARSRMVADNLSGLEDVTVGVVGLGTIGLAVAQRFHLMGSRIIFFDSASRRADAVSAMAARQVGLDELLETSDVVTLHVPLLPETRDMIGARELSRMKPAAVLINAARGGVVNEAALAAALTQGRLGGAAVDVYGAEPPDASNPLFAVGGEAASRLLFTPHIAGITRQSWQALFRAAWQNVEDVLLRGAPARYRVE